MRTDSPYHVMIINGSHEMLQLLSELIEELGQGEYTCSLATLEDTHHVDLIREARPHLVVIDQPFYDPKMEGWELVQKIRLARDLSQTPIIFTTTNVQLLHELDAQLAVLNVRPILKPFDPDSLMIEVRNALNDVDASRSATRKGRKQNE